MFTTYFTYVILGISLSLPVGAMTVEMTKQGLKNGFFHGWLVGIGGMTIDFTMILLIYFGFSSFLTNPVIELVMWVLGFLFLLYIGWDSIKNANHDIALGDDAPKRSFLKSYANGFMIAISPANLIFWLGIFGTVLAASLSHVNSYTFLLVASGILTGILVHDLGLLAIIQVTRNFINATFMKWSSIIAGLILIGFSVYFFYKSIVGISQLL
ncbi:LysE family translocator [Ectobacillus polymachus]|uniref:LysE family translocator n=1 Tax=Ectobacillus polymachus TaxID=1508806 RepID=UPI003A88630F